MEISEIYNRLADLNKEKEMLETDLQEKMARVIFNIGQENPYEIKKCNGMKMMTMSSSQLSNRSWSMVFYDWESGADAVLKYLKHFDVTIWKSKLESMISNDEVIYLTDYGVAKPWSPTMGNRTPVDRRFIEKIVSMF